MTNYYTVKFHRVAFGDTKYKDVPIVSERLEELKEEAREGLFARFKDMKAAGKGSRAPHSAALLDENDHVIARFEVRPKVPGSGEEAVELPPEIWHDRMPGTPSAAIIESLQ
jgi:hypothetical protein